MAVSLCVATALAAPLTPTTERSLDAKQPAAPPQALDAERATVLLFVDEDDPAYTRSQSTPKAALQAGEAPSRLHYAYVHCDNFWFVQRGAEGIGKKDIVVGVQWATADATDEQLRGGTEACADGDDCPGWESVRLANPEEEDFDPTNPGLQPDQFLFEHLNGRTLLAVSLVANLGNEGAKGPAEGEHMNRIMRVPREGGAREIRIFTMREDGVTISKAWEPAQQHTGE